MARLVFAPEMLSCITSKNAREARRCLYERDLGLLRVFTYSYVSLVACMHECRGPVVVIVVSHDRVTVRLEDCGNPEGAAWSLHELLERLPGVWYVRTQVKDGSVLAETIPYEHLYG